MITIGIDPHKSSHTAVAVDAAGHQLAQRRFAVEGAKGLGRSLAHQLHRLAGIGVLEVADAVLAADHFLLLTSGPVSERSHHGAASLSAPARTALITAGVRAFLHGYLPKKVC